MPTVCYCPKCNITFDSVINVRFCTQCGTPLVTQQAEQAAVDPSKTKLLLNE
jgi:hypothetical protein